MPLSTRNFNPNGDCVDIGKLLAAAFAFEITGDLGFWVSVFDPAVTHAISHRPAKLMPEQVCINPLCFRFARAATAGSESATSAAVDVGVDSLPPLAAKTPREGHVHHLILRLRREKLALPLCFVSGQAVRDGGDMRTPGVVICIDLRSRTTSPEQARLLLALCGGGGLDRFLRSMGYAVHPLSVNSICSGNDDSAAALPALAHVLRRGDTELNFDHEGHIDILMRCMLVFLAMQPIPLGQDMDGDEDGDEEDSEEDPDEMGVMRALGAAAGAPAGATHAAPGSKRAIGGPSVEMLIDDLQDIVSHASDSPAVRMAKARLGIDGCKELAARVIKQLVGECLADVAPTARPMGQRSVRWSARFVPLVKMQVLLSSLRDLKLEAEMAESYATPGSTGEEPAIQSLESAEGQQLLLERKLWTEVADMQDDILWMAEAHKQASLMAERSKEQRERSRMWHAEWMELESRIKDLHHAVVTEQGMTPVRFVEAFDKIEAMYSSLSLISNQAEPEALTLAMQVLDEESWHEQRLNEYRKVAQEHRDRMLRHGIRVPPEAVELEVLAQGDLRTLTMHLQIPKLMLEGMQQPWSDPASGRMGLMCVFGSLQGECNRLHRLASRLRGMVRSWTTGVRPDGKWIIFRRKDYDLHMLELVLGILNLKSRVLTAHMRGPGEGGGGHVNMCALADSCFQKAADQVLGDQQTAVSARRRQQQQVFAVFSAGRFAIGLGSVHAAGMDIDDGKEEPGNTRARLAGADIDEAEGQLRPLREVLCMTIGKLDVVLPRVHHVLLHASLVKARDGLVTLLAASLTLREEVMLGLIGVNAMKAQMAKLKVYTDNIVGKLRLPPSLDAVVSPSVAARLAHV